MANFLKAYDMVMSIEGGYVNDPVDRGGETYKGISRKNWPRWEGWKTIDYAKTVSNKFPANLKLSIALETSVRVFYKKEFWDKMRLDDINDQSIALEMFDTGVHMSPAYPVMFLQRALNVLNRNQLNYKDIIVDGKIGIRTIEAVNKHPDPEMVYNVINTLQGARYIEICEANPSQEKYMNGWLKRVYQPLYS